MIQANRTSYVIGFILSIVLTLAAYFVAWAGKPTLYALAALQIVAQLLLFFQLGKESKPYWNLVVFLFMGLVAVILIGGSLWILSNLDRRMMP